MAVVMSTKSPRILFYDCETTPLQARIWHLGEQVVRHTQLVPGFDSYRIICISYAWNDNKPAKTIDWGYQAQDSARVVAEFDKVAKHAEVIIGKNSDRFDVKHVNTQRLLHGLPPFPDWMNYTDDVEKQLRKYFVFPSFSLDYVSKEFGLGGKIKMAFQDWVDIVQKSNRASFAKMLKYNRKDVEDTRALWNKLKPYIKPKANVASLYAMAENPSTCPACKSSTLTKRGYTYSTSQRRQRFQCSVCRTFSCGQAESIVIASSK